MKNTKNVQRRYTDTVIESITCDICKKTYKGEHWDRDSGFDVLETEVRMKTGTLFPESGSGEEVTFDICPRCFVEKLMPALKAMGAEPIVRDWDIG